MNDISLLQHYWWFLVSLLGSLLVFLMFVQGGQSLIWNLGRTEEQRRMLLLATGRKWELTFTTLVTFGGAFFASQRTLCGDASSRSVSGEHPDIRQLSDIPS